MTLHSFEPDDYDSTALEEVLMERRQIPPKPFLHPEDFIRELQPCQVGQIGSEVLKALIKVKCGEADCDDAADPVKWKPILISLLQLLASSTEIGDETILLGALAFVNVLSQNCEPEEYTKNLRTFWSLETPELSVFDENYRICDLELFRLALIYGYVKINIGAIYTPEMTLLPFEILRRNCLSYTKYSYFAYKNLHYWLDKSVKTNFWFENDTSRTEKELEAIIFSNWDSCISEIARRNATKIFPTYLRLMSEKYENFANFVFHNCLKNLSWQNVTKYAILKEVCDVLGDSPTILSSDLPACIFTSITKNHLKHAGTKLYLTILKMLKGNEWESIFGKSFLRISEKWEKEEQFAAIEVLWEQWMKPTMAKFSQVFQYLWKNKSMKRLELSRTYLEMIGDRLGFELIYEDTNIREVLNRRIEDSSEQVRVNAFTIICQNKNWTPAEIGEESYIVIKRFLYFNIDTSSAIMKKVIIKNFTKLTDNILTFGGKSEIQDYQNNKAHEFRDWLHDFLLNCLEIGSSYQRKNLALSLYKVMLDFKYRETATASRKKCPKKGEIDSEEYEAYKDWKRNITDRRSLLVFLRLILDPMGDIREKSSHIIVEHSFDWTFTSEEHTTLHNVAESYYNSSKFYEAASGSKLRSLHATLWNPAGACGGNSSENENSHQIASTRLIRSEAVNQLKKMKHTQDILNCAVNGSPFFGSMMTLLELGTIGDCSRNRVFVYEADSLLDIAKEATDFFLSVLSSKTKKDEYSSSFEEMGLAIEESIRNSGVNENTDEWILSTSHQLLVSCIWTSLKVCCDLAALLGVKGFVSEKSAADLMVSVLLKCRHKGAIEAAGSALSELILARCKNEVFGAVIERYISDLLNIDDKDTINLTRRGAGLSIMFHRIISNDNRKNRPTLHLAVRKLLDSLKERTEDTAVIPGIDYTRDSSRARHLHFLRSLVSDKSLQAQLVPYMEDICLACFELIQSPEWIVRNASLQLLGAIVPRLVGQCGARELDYGVGNSVDYFVTHYPILADSVLNQLELLASTIDILKNRRDAIFHAESNIVPILTIFSKLSSGGCELVDYSSRNYISRAKLAFAHLFGHPVVHLRVLAGKAYAAFVALPEIPRVLAAMKNEAVEDKSNNYQHGQLCAQIYLVHKLEHEMQCTSETFAILKHSIWNAELKRGLESQLQKFSINLRHRSNRNNRNYSYTVHAALIRCLMESRAFLSSFNLRPEFHNCSVKTAENLPLKAGVMEFTENLKEFLQQYNLDSYNDTPESEIAEGRSNVSTLKKDTSFLLKRILEISEKLYDNDEDVQRSVIDLLPSFVLDAKFSQDDLSFNFDPRTEYWKLLIQVIITMLTDEDYEVREKMAKILHPITKNIIGHSSRSLCARAVCHKILNKLSLAWIDDPSETMIESIFEIFKRLASMIKVTETAEGLQSPFNQDETFHRDYASLINILFYCVVTFIKRKRPTGIGIDDREVQQIDGIIGSSSASAREAFMDSEKIDIILLSTSDYLSCKKLSLMTMIEEHRSVK